MPSSLLLDPLLVFLLTFGQHILFEELGNVADAGRQRLQVNIRGCGPLPPFSIS